MSQLGPTGPFPLASLDDELDRRWLHYAFRSADGDVSVIANLSTLGSSDPSREPESMAILLVHDSSTGWQSSQFNCRVQETPWSAFRLEDDEDRFFAAGASQQPSVDLALTRTGRACTSQCAPFARDQYLRWQSEPGICAVGDVRVGSTIHAETTLLGYHERVRGRWGWPQLGGWVFGFANATPAVYGEPPPYSIVFTLIQPRSPKDSANASVMLWRHGRLLRHFPRRSLDVAVVGSLSRDRVVVCPPLAGTLGTPPTAEVPGRLAITAAMGGDHLELDFRSVTAGRIVNPSELGISPFSVHEVLGPCTVTGRVSGEPVDFEAAAVVEFAGGALVD